MNNKTSASPLIIAMMTVALTCWLPPSLPAQYASTIIANSPPPDSWRGGYGNWSDAHNWTAGVPGSGSLNQDAVVATNHDQVNWNESTSLTSLFTVGTGTSDSIVNGTPGNTMNISGPLIVRSGAFTLDADIVTARADSIISGMGLGDGSSVQIEGTLTCTGGIGMGILGGAGNTLTVTGPTTFIGNSVLQAQAPSDIVRLTSLVNSGGSLNLEGGATLEVSGDVSNSGCISTSSGGFCFPLGFSGSTVRVGGTLTNNFSNVGVIGLLMNTGDLLMINQLINLGSMYFKGGSLMTADLTSGVAANYSLDISGLDQFAVSHVSDNLALAGTLQIYLQGGFRPANGETFKIFLFPPGHLTGTFVSVNPGWEVLYDNPDGHVELVAVSPNTVP